MILLIMTQKCRMICALFTGKHGWMWETDRQACVKRKLCRKGHTSANMLTGTVVYRTQTTWTQALHSDRHAGRNDLMSKELTKIDLCEK